MNNKQTNTDWSEDLLSEKKERKAKKDIDIDMNPMVDLAFLLLTFFMLTTTFKQPHIMEIFYPIDDKKTEANEQLIKESRTVSIVLAKDNRIFHYQGITKAEVKECDYSSDGLRKVLFDYLNSIDGLIILVKPSQESSYRNFVDMLDEIAITAVKRYSIVNIEEWDKELISNQIDDYVW